MPESGEIVVPQCTGGRCAALLGHVIGSVHLPVDVVYAHSFCAPLVPTKHTKHRPMHSCGRCLQYCPCSSQARGTSNLISQTLC